MLKFWRNWNWSCCCKLCYEGIKLVCWLMIWLRWTCEKLKLSGCYQCSMRTGSLIVLLMCVISSGIAIVSYWWCFSLVFIYGSKLISIQETMHHVKMQTQQLSCLDMQPITQPKNPLASYSQSTQPCIQPDFKSHNRSFRNWPKDDWWLSSWQYPFHILLNLSKSEIKHV